MTLESYRVHVEHLWHEVNRAKFYAEQSGQVAHWDWFYRARVKAQAAERYLRKREAKEAAA